MFPYWHSFSQQALEELPNHGFPAGRLPEPSSASDGTNIDWKETPTEHVFIADVPGFKKEELKVEIEDGRLIQISGQRRRQEEQNTDTWYRVERSSGSFSRRFRLLEYAKIDHIKASMEDGVLTVIVPNEEPKETDIRSIQISG